jgi:hypothetical protein
MSACTGTGKIREFEMVKTSSLRDRLIAIAAAGLLLLPLAGCGLFHQRTASDRMVNAPKGPEAPPKRPDEAPPPQAAPQPSVQAAPLAPPPRR